MVKKRKYIKVVFFDLDDTLYSHKCANSKIKSELKALEFFCQNHPKFNLVDVYKVFNDAKEYVEKALFIQNDNAEILEHMGDILAKLNKTVKAKDYYRRALEFDPKNEGLKQKLSK